MSSRPGVMNVAIEETPLTPEMVVQLDVESWFVYIIHSGCLGKYYTGISTKPHTRLRQHRDGVSGWTRRADDWEFAYLEKMESECDARRFERAIKKRGAKRYIQELSASRSNAIKQCAGVIQWQNVSFPS